MTVIRVDRGAVDELARDPDLLAKLAPHARAVAEQARQLAPDETGAYRRSIQVDGNRVLTTDPFGHLVEWGSVHNPAYAPLRRAIRAAGLRFDPGPQ